MISQTPLLLLHLPDTADQVTAVHDLCDFAPKALLSKTNSHYYSQIFQVEALLSKLCSVGDQVLARYVLSKDYAVLD